MHGMFSGENSAQALDMDGKRIRVGLISDTHDLLRPEALAFLRGCDHIVHAGDVCDATILVALADLGRRTDDRWRRVLGADRRDRGR